MVEEEQSRSCCEMYQEEVSSSLLIHSPSFLEVSKACTSNRGFWNRELGAHTSTSLLLSLGNCRNLNGQEQLVHDEIKVLIGLDHANIGTGSKPFSLLLVFLMKVVSKLLMFFVFFWLFLECNTLFDAWFGLVWLFSEAS